MCGEADFELWFQAELLQNSSTHLLFNLSLADPAEKYNQLRLTYGCEKDEQIYGFGAQYSKFNLKGERLPLFLSEQGVGRGLEPLTFILNLFSPGSGDSTLLCDSKAMYMHIKQDINILHWALSLSRPSTPVALHIIYCIRLQLYTEALCYVMQRYLTSVSMPQEALYTNQQVYDAVHFVTYTGGSWYTTYTRVPHYITSYQRSLMLESLEYTVFDMRHEDSIVIEIQSSSLIGQIITGQHNHNSIVAATSV